MYAVIETGGKQLKVEVGDVVQVESLPAETGAEIVFDRVLMLGGGTSDATMRNSDVATTIVNVSRRFGHLPKSGVRAAPAAGSRTAI